MDTDHAIVRDIIESSLFNANSSSLDPFGSYYLHPSFVRLNVTRPYPQSSSSSNEGKSASHFPVMLNVRHFRPGEVEVKTVDDFVVIHAKHEEKADEHGFISREFTRRYKLPDDADREKVTSSLGKDGILKIDVPMKTIVLPAKGERVVPIICEPRVAAGETQKIQEQ